MTMTPAMAIDLNCDLGEALPGINDSELMPFLSSCNVACGGHAGDPRSMQQAVRQARHHEVAVGAHPSYPDRQGFGRRTLELEAGALRRSIVDQCRALQRIARQEGVRVRHVKPHGALYNDLVHDEALAGVFLDAVRELKVEVAIYGLAWSPFGERVAGRGLRFVHEAFADRAYDQKGRLVPRSQATALLTDPQEVLRQTEKLLFRTGSRPDSLCVHSDTPGAVDLLRELTTWLKAHDVAVRAPG